MPETRKTREEQQTKRAGENNSEKDMPLSGHLRELRNRVFVYVVVLLAALLAALHFAPELVEALLAMGEQYGYSFIYISPQELLLQYFSLSILVGAAVTFPLLLYQIWAFVSPGLKKGENGFFLFAMIFGLFCFCAGLLFAWKIMLPFMLNFLYSLNESSTITASISVGNYVSFLMTLFVIFGAIFELPIVSILLTQLGLMKPEWMRKVRKPAIVVIFFIAAVVTPPDVVSQTMVAIPMILLYELSIWLSTLISAFKKKKNKE